MYNFLFISRFKTSAYIFFCIVGNRDERKGNMLKYQNIILFVNQLYMIRLTICYLFTETVPVFQQMSRLQHKLSRIFQISSFKKGRKIQNGELSKYFREEFVLKEFFSMSWPVLAKILKVSDFLQKKKKIVSLYCIILFLASAQ